MESSTRCLCAVALLHHHSCPSPSKLSTAHLSRDRNAKLEVKTRSRSHPQGRTRSRGTLARHCKLEAKVHRNCSKSKSLSRKKVKQTKALKSVSEQKFKPKWLEPK
eukprot:5831168-Amphidinium_carterae.1